MFSGRVRQRPIVVKMEDAAEGLVKTEHADSLGVQSFVPVPPPCEATLRQLAAYIVPLGDAATKEKLRCWPLRFNQ